MHHRRALGQLGTLHEMDPVNFWKWLVDYSMRNSGTGYNQLSLLTCGARYLGDKCVNFVVSIILEKDCNKLRKRGVHQAGNGSFVEILDR